MRSGKRSALFARARGGDLPTDDDCRRVRAALGRKIGIAAGVAVGTTLAEGTGMAGGTTTALGVGGSAAVAKVVAVVVALAAAVTAGTLGMRGSGESTRGLTAKGALSASAVTTAAPLASGVPVASAASVTPPVSLTVVSPPPSSYPVAQTRATVAKAVASPIAADPNEKPAAALTPPPPDQTAQELALVQGMQAALRGGDAAGALALIGEHERRFANGKLVPEREGAKVIALCMSASRSRAAELGRAFLEGHPRATVAARVRATCGLDGANDSNTGLRGTGQ
jgi:hypothetical protein